MKIKKFICSFTLLLLLVLMWMNNFTAEILQILFQPRSFMDTTPVTIGETTTQSQQTPLSNNHFDQNNENEKIFVLKPTFMTSALHSTTTTMERLEFNMDGFPVAQYFSFPHPGGALKNRIELLNSEWFDELKLILSLKWKHNNTNVIMVSSNYQYITVLLNWLISAVVVAKLNLNNILVLSFDQNTHSLLQARHISSLLVLPASLFEKHMKPSLWMTRLVIIRLLNHWGYNVAHFDADALIVQSPEPLFAQFNGSAIIGSQGSFPSALSHKWGGATLCAGVMVTKTCKETEDFWQAMSKILRKSLSDQERVNYALDSLGIEWHHNGQIIEGRCKNGLRVTLLSHSHVCRSNCKRSELKNYYVWHKAGQKNSDSKRKTALDGKLWYLRNDWSTMCNRRADQLNGIDWLECISSPELLVTT